MSSFVLTLLAAVASCVLVAESVPLSSFKDVAVACNVTKREFLALGELYGSPNKVVELAVESFYQNDPRYKAFSEAQGYDFHDVSTDAAQQAISFITERWFDYLNIVIHSSDSDKEDKFDARWNDHPMDESNAGHDLPSVADECADEYETLAKAKNMQPYTDAAWRTCIKFHFDYIID